MKDTTPKLSETYYFYTKGKTHPYKYVGTKGKYYVFDFYGKLINLTPARFNFLYRNCNMGGVEQKEPTNEKSGLLGLLKKKKKN